MSSKSPRTRAEDYDPTDREAAHRYVRAAHDRGEVATGLLYTEGSADMHGINGRSNGFDVVMS